MKHDFEQSENNSKAVTKLTIVYTFRLSLQIRTKKGKLWKAHIEQAIGSRYEDAIWSVYFTIKKRGHSIISVNTATVENIAFALSDGEFLQLKLSDHLPSLPENLNEIIEKLPKK